jgi:hypothetical protein
MFNAYNFTVNFLEYQKNRITVCNITCHNVLIAHRVFNISPRTTDIVYLGIARLKPGDKRNKYEAQIVSLGRALKCIGLPKEFRQSFIEAWKKDFLSHHPKEKNRS